MCPESLLPGQHELALTLYQGLELLAGSPLLTATLSPVWSKGWAKLPSFASPEIPYRTLEVSLNPIHIPIKRSLATLSE